MVPAPTLPLPPDAADSRTAAQRRTAAVCRKRFRQDLHPPDRQAAGPTPPSSATTLATRRAVQRGLLCRAPWRAAAGRCRARRPFAGHFSGAVPHRLPYCARWTWATRWSCACACTSRDAGPHWPVAAGADSEIKPPHSTLIRLLCQGRGAPRPTTTSTRLALAISPCRCSTTPTAT